MAPSSRARATQQADNATQVVKITELPEAVLAKCLGFLDLKQRLGPASLACKRFAAAARSPELLRDMHVVDLQNVPAVRSFTGFLAQHGRHLQRLTVRCADSTGEGELAAVAAAAACLTIAGVGAQLMELSASGCIRSSDWLAAMRSLRRLCLDSQPYGEPLHVSPAISALTALSALTLEGDIIMPTGTRLPARIELATLQFDSLDTFPHQVAQLPRLASLCLDSCQYSPASLGVLSCLSSSLTRLDIESGYLPGSMSALTQLRDLRLWDCDPHGTDAVLSTALPHLRHLSRLVVMTDDAAVPAALAGLSNLQHCHLRLQAGDDIATPPLPAGPWLASLRWLHYPICGLVSSTAALQAAAALEVLKAGCSETEVDWTSPAAAAFFDWLAQHPPLRRACFDGKGRAFDSGYFAAHVAWLARRRLGLEISFWSFDGFERFINSV